MASDNISCANDGDAFQVELVLVSIVANVQGDSSGNQLPGLVDDIFHALSCTKAENAWHNHTAKKGWKQLFQSNQQEEADEQNLAADLKKSITRFVKTPDKYIALGSILLKSRAFHATHFHSTEPLSNKQLPIVELPRTEYRKPYIPGNNDSNSNNTQLQPHGIPEMNWYPLSISHHFPFVGSTRLVIGDNMPLHQRPLVGLDLVTFDEFNTRLYNSVDDFVEVFQTSFTSWEWQAIHASGASKLQEFYLRWAIKEAYTKALGVGMGLAFDSFETHLAELELHNDKNENQQEQGIFDWLCENWKDETSFLKSQGSVVMKGDTKSEEAYTFCFLPLWKEDEAVETPSKTMQNAVGCVCLCLIHLPDQDTPPQFELIIQWKKLDDLVTWHKDGGGNP